MSQEWQRLASRRTPILEAHLRLLGWSKGFRTLFGEEFHDAIVVSPGDFYVETSSLERVESVIPAADVQPRFMSEFGAHHERMLVSAQDPKWNPSEFLDQVAHYFALFHIARIEADRAYADSSDEDLRRRIELWRNEPGHFAAMDHAWERLEKEKGISKDLFLSCTADELRDWLSGAELPWPEIGAREIWSLVLKDGQIRFAPEDLHPISDGPAGADELKGQVVYGLGILRGLAGKEILIASMTTPDMLPQVRQAKAVVTDEGGQLSHAAIMCRELHIPCLIATGRASKVFHEGDLLELDLDVGTVRRIESADLSDA